MSKSSLITLINTKILTAGRRTSAIYAREVYAAIANETFNMGDPATGTLAGDNLFPLIQSGVSKLVKLSDISTFIGGGGSTPTLAAVLATGNSTNDVDVVSILGKTRLSIKDAGGDLIYQFGGVANSVSVSSNSTRMDFDDGTNYGSFVIASPFAYLQHSVSLQFDAPEYGISNISTNTYLYVNGSGKIVAGVAPLTSVPNLISVLAAGRSTGGGSINSPDTKSKLSLFDGSAEISYRTGIYENFFFLSSGDVSSQWSDGTDFSILTQTVLGFQLQTTQAIEFDGLAYKFTQLTASSVLYLDASKNLISSSVTPTELGYVSGVTSSIQPQLNAITGAGYITTISGIAAGGDLSGTYANPSVLNSAVIGKFLTGLNITGSTISATDTILQAFGKLQNQVNGVLGGAIYQGVYNATTNSPTLVDGTGTKGYYYVVSVGGTRNFGSGSIIFEVGDWVIYNGTIWQKVDNTDAVTSVNGYIGAVSLVTSDITESGSLYYTNARGIASVLTGYTSGAGVISSTDTILQAIQKLNGNTAAISGAYVTTVNGSSGAISNVAITTNTLAQFAPTTSAQLRILLSDENGTGSALFNNATSPTFTTDITTPKIYGGTAVGSKIDYQSTTGIGTTTAAAHEFWGGNNGATNLFSVYNDGQFLIGTNTRSGGSANPLLRIGQGTGLVDIGSLSTTNGAIFLNQSSPSATNYALQGTSSITFLNATTTVDCRISNNSKLVISSTKIGIANALYIGSTSASPTAILQLIAGTSAANSSPFKFTLTSAAVNTIAEAGSFEADSNGLIYTTAVGTTRSTITRALFTGTADATVTNTTADTSILPTGVGTKTIKNSDLIVGRTFIVYIAGVYSTPAVTGGTATVKIKIGAATIASVNTSSLLTNASGLRFEGCVTITVRSVGASGTVMCSGSISYATGVAGTMAADSLDNGGSTTTVDTTADRALDITVAWDTASSSKIAKCTECFIEVLN